MKEVGYVGYHETILPCKLAIHPQLARIETSLDQRNKGFLVCVFASQFFQLAELRFFHRLEKCLKMSVLPTRYSRKRQELEKKLLDILIIQQITKRSNWL